MNNQVLSNSFKYLRRFDEILKEMEQAMLSQQITDNITQDFIICMIPHHQAAIYMCENLLMYRSNYRLQRLARQIIEVQTKRINRMLLIQRTLVGYKSKKSDVDKYMKRYYSIVREMTMGMRRSLRSTNISLDFISEMIPHHMGAIKMCENVLQYDIDPRLRDLANEIIKEQSNNIVTLKNIRRSILNNKL